MPSASSSQLRPIVLRRPWTRARGSTARSSYGAFTARQLRFSSPRPCSVTERRHGLAHDEVDHVGHVPTALDVAVGHEAGLSQRLPVLVQRHEQRPSAHERLGRRHGRDVGVGADCRHPRVEAGPRCAARKTSASVGPTSVWVSLAVPARKLTVSGRSGSAAELGCGQRSGERPGLDRHAPGRGRRRCRTLHADRDPVNVEHRASPVDVPGYHELGRLQRVPVLGEGEVRGMVAEARVELAERERDRASPRPRTVAVTRSSAFLALGRVGPAR